MLDASKAFDMVRYCKLFNQKSTNVFKGRFSNVSACGFHVNGQYVEVSKCAMHLGHSISSGDRTEIGKYAKNVLE